MEVYFKKNLQSIGHNYEVIPLAQLDLVKNPSVSPLGKGRKNEVWQLNQSKKALRFFKEQ